MKRIIGLLMMLIGIALVGLTAAGIFYGRQAIDAAGGSVESSLELVSESLDTVSSSLLLVKTTINDAAAGMGTVEDTAVNLSKTVGDIEPLLEGISQVISEDAPNSIEALQSTVPNMAEVAGVIDDTLIILSNFGFKQEIPVPFSDPIGFNFNLGIEYEPEEPFDETIEAMGQSLDGLPEQLRSLSGELETTSANLAIISEDILLVSGDLGTINEDLKSVGPLIDEYIGIVTQINDAMRQVRAQILPQLETVKLALTLLLAFLGLSQIAPLYLGWELVTGRRDEDNS